MIFTNNLLTEIKQLINMSSQEKLRLMRLHYYRQAVMPTVEELSAEVIYYPTSGLFTDKHGERIGSFQDSVYLELYLLGEEPEPPVIEIDGVKYSAAGLAMYLKHGFYSPINAKIAKHRPACALDNIKSIKQATIGYNAQQGYIYLKRNDMPVKLNNANSHGIVNIFNQHVAPKQFCWYCLTGDWVDAKSIVYVDGNRNNHLPSNLKRVYTPEQQSALIEAKPDDFVFSDIAVLHFGITPDDKDFTVVALDGDYCNLSLDNMIVKNKVK